MSNAKVRHRRRRRYWKHFWNTHWSQEEIDRINKKAYKLWLMFGAPKEGQTREEFELSAKEYFKQ